MTAPEPPRGDLLRVRLREVTDEDVAAFREHLGDAAAAQMAAFAPKEPPDPAAHLAHWERNRSSAACVARTVLVDDRVAGNVVSFLHEGRRHVAYWIDRPHWGRGVATRALTLLLHLVTERPLRALVAYDNLGSIRVLEKCGFIRVGAGRWFAPARGAEIEEFVYELRA
jgi:RimJ/RimL family protein N-acetyltransferase